MKPKHSLVTGVFDPPLDPGIAGYVAVLRENGVETFESCEGGKDHAYPQPSVRFHGTRAEGLRVLSKAMESGMPVDELHRVWRVEDGDVTGPWWELTFAHRWHDVEEAK